MSEHAWLGVLLSDGDEPLERPVDSEPLASSPLVEIEGDRLIYRAQGRFGDSTPAFRDGSLSTMVEQFLELADAPSDQIRRYAQRWGVLRICAHGLPASHNSRNLLTGVTRLTPCVPLTEIVERIGQPPAYVGDSSLSRDGGPRPPIVERTHQGFEPIGAWRQFSRQARAILRIVAAHREQERADREDLRVLFRWLWFTAGGHDCPISYDPDTGAVRACEHEPKEDITLTPALQRQLIHKSLDDWSAMADIRLRFGWTEAGEPLRITGAGVFGELAIQLMMLVHQSNGFAICSSRGCIYVPERRPRRGEHRYCPNCRPSGGRDRMKRLRARRTSPAAVVDSNSDSKPSGS